MVSYNETWVFIIINFLFLCDILLIWPWGLNINRPIHTWIRIPASSMSWSPSSHWFSVLKIKYRVYSIINCSLIYKTDKFKLGPRLLKEIMKQFNSLTVKMLARQTVNKTLTFHCGYFNESLHNSTENRSIFVVGLNFVKYYCRCRVECRLFYLS